MPSAVTLTSALVLTACCLSNGLQAEDAPRLLLTGHVGEKAAPAIPGILSHEFVEVEHPLDNPARASIVIPTQEGLLELELERHSIRALDFELLVHDGLQYNVMEAPAPRTYRGRVLGLEGSSVRGSIMESGLHARIDLGAGRGVWWIQPVSTLDIDGVEPPEDATELTHALMHGATGTFLEGYRCGNDLIEIEGPEGQAGGGLAMDQPGNRLNSIAACADYEYFQLNGSSVTNTLNDIELMIGLYEAIYEDDPGQGGVNVNFEFAASIIHASPNDPYSASGASNILCEFRSEWNSGEETGIRRDIAQMFTGKNLGSTIGIAYLGVVCNLTGNTCGSIGNVAYSLVESRYTGNLTFRTSLGAHELGHNYGASHCDSDSDCEIMCSGNGACVPGPNDFNARSRQSITNYVNSASCDIAVGDAITLPFSDDFSSISTTTWIYNKGGIASTGGVNEPSPSRSLQLDATGSSTYAFDEIRSRTILAANYGDLYLSFHTQFRGVDAGEGLLVEYVNSSGDWTELDQILSSNGATESVYTFHEYLMPSNAVSNRLRLRFVALVDSSADDIYIDDVSLGDPIDPPADPPANDECASSVVITQPSTYPINLDGATTSAVPGCSVLQSDAWWYFVSPIQGTATVTLCGSAALDTAFALYNGLSGCPFQESQLITCQNDSPECGDDPYFQFETTEYPAVYIRIGTFDGQTSPDDLLLTISVEEAPEDCPGDFDLNGEVDGADLAWLLGNWNTPAADLDGSGNTDGADLSIVLGNWGFCP